MNTITIELCAEDRARLDKLTAALEARVKQETPLSINNDLDNMLKKALHMPTAEAPKNATGETEEPALPVTPKTEEAPTATEEAQPEAVQETIPAELLDSTEEPTKPTVTLEQIQQKVVQLAAGFNGTKKAAVREIINAYAKKVSDLPEDKWDEVMGKLTALEKEVTEA